MPRNYKREADRPFSTLVKGGAGMTRTSLRLPDSEVFAAAGIWRRSDAWGDVYSMAITYSCGAAAECLDRMPVLLAARDYGAWGGCDGGGGEGAVRAICGAGGGGADGGAVGQEPTELMRVKRCPGACHSFRSASE